LTPETLNLQKLEEMAHYIVDQCQSKDNFGKVVFWKLLYFSDFNHYKRKFSAISNEQYRKIDLGPAPCHFDKILENLQAKGKIEVTPNKNEKEPWIFRSLEKPQTEHLNKDELATIDNVIHKLGHLRAGEISDLSHEDNPYKASEDGKIISYGLVFYRNNDIQAKVE